MEELKAIELATAFISEEIAEGQLLPHRFHSAQKFRANEISRHKDDPQTYVWIVRFELEEEPGVVTSPGITMIEVCDASGAVDWA